MTRGFALLFFLMLIAGCSDSTSSEPSVAPTSPPAKPADAGTEGKVIQGEWTLQLIRSNGQSLNKPTPSRLGKVDTAIKGLGTVTFSESDVKIAPNGELSLFPNSSFFRPTNGTYRIDVSHTPWTIDLVMPDFSGKPQTIEAVYSRDGNVLRLCLPTGANMSRPTEVSGEQGKSSAVWQLVRIE